ncbi:RNA polymerase sigma factor, sigma-70 family [Filimonas lacunae]|uniref:RNA polymerase sigma factor, sigma-70 family n=1 Tax=Filimonas lacunae TaxID=477680 RepID=A0A173MMQ1_9BACT|nr:sigma-70 family RNA polymerase sigma factor [Filimonas lacunae]BAV08914.1 RNA polymerase ECF-type sigma factor [Filimonas lacunae]SIS63917.1 RNA polymerase sigma factor, sigma-70 family [Filimonas lacunae]
MITSDSLLWRQFLNGDKASFEQIYRLHYRSLYEFGMRKTNDEELVKECMQALFVKLWLNRQGISETANPKYYLITSLKNTIVSAQTANGRVSHTGDREEDYFQLSFTETDKLAGADEKTKQLIDAMNQLTGRQKEVIYLRFFEEMPYEQIAELMDVSVKGVYKLNSRALDALKDILDISKKDLLVLLALCKIYFQ